MRTFDEIFRQATGHDPFPYQRALAEEARPPALLLRVPTGAGKTAAAVLSWLYRRRFHPDPAVRHATPRRLVYSLPMRVLVEQTYDVARTWLQRLHLTDEVDLFLLMGGEVPQDWVRHPERDAILVGTMDMLLSRALNRGFAARRFRWPVDFALLHNDALWVCDEVQLMSNGLATSVQLDAFRRRFGTVRPAETIWMSATVAPEWLRTVDAAPPPERTLSAADRGSPLAQRLTAAKRLQRLTDDKLDAPVVLAHHRPGTLTLVVVNTVERAQRLYRELARRATDPVILLHSRFRPPERRAAFERVRQAARGSGAVVVATQVIEAGVDLSAATLITELAPWPSIVQRLGRCNRFGEWPDAVAYWVNVRDAAPYTEAELEVARSRLPTLEGRSVAPIDLETLDPGPPPEPTHLVRASDLVDLFDTEPDLAGFDVDISRFLRDDADLDVAIAWRAWPGEAPPATMPPDIGRDELCPVPVWEAREFLFPKRSNRTVPAFVWDPLAERWVRLDRADLRPGLTLLLPSRAGGYDPTLGWDRSSGAEVPPIPPPAEGAGDLEGASLGEDSPAEAGRRWETLAQHTQAVVDALEELLAPLGDALAPEHRAALRAAARWHDVGKAHHVFQQALLAGLPEAERAARRTTLWAKSARGATHYERRFFRHEVASALAVLAALQPAPQDVGSMDPQTWRDLVAYLVMAHHGKVRLALRSLPEERPPCGPDKRFARGVCETDELPPLTLPGLALPALRLNLSVMDAGRTDGQPSWSERTLRLRDRFGPFRLAFLEALLRIADWRGSATPADPATTVAP